MDVHQKKGAQMSMNVNGNGYNPYLQRTSSSSKTTGANNVDSTGETKEEKIKKLTEKIKTLTDSITNLKAQAESYEMQAENVKNSVSSITAAAEIVQTLVSQLAVSYTHLDVYKRQEAICACFKITFISVNTSS